MFRQIAHLCIFIEINNSSVHQVNQQTHKKEAENKTYIHCILLLKLLPLTICNFFTTHTHIYIGIININYHSHGTK